MNYFCSFASGSSGNCSFYCDGTSRILIDAGTNTKYINACLKELSLTVGDLTHILITHSHSDHTSALPVLLKHTAARVICSEDTCRGIKTALPEPMVFEQGESFQAGNVFVQSFKTPHDACGSCGFILGEGENRVAYCTDLGQMTAEIFYKIMGSETVFLESNHDIEMLKNGAYPYFLKKRILSENGHLSNAMCAKTTERLVQSGTKRIILAHLSRENNTPRLARETTMQALCRAGAEKDVELSVAPAMKMGEPVVFGEVQCLI